MVLFTVYFVLINQDAPGLIKRLFQKKRKELDTCALIEWHLTM
jgi:hypothetical protein